MSVAAQLRPGDGRHVRYSITLRTFERTQVGLRECNGKPEINAVNTCYVTAQGRQDRCAMALCNRWRRLRTVAELGVMDTHS